MAGGERVGTFRQVDTYYSLGERRLKVRSVEGAREGQLVYYERPDEGGVKESRVLLAPLPEVATVLEILRRVLPVQAEVRKTREVHRYRGVEVHLDTVKGLGRFIEFEKVLADESEGGGGAAGTRDSAAVLPDPGRGHSPRGWPHSRVTRQGLHDPPVSGSLKAPAAFPATPGDDDGRRGRDVGGREGQ